MPRICIVSNAPVSQNPRLVKEADCLTAAGYQVHVIFIQYHADVTEFDQRIVKNAKWTSEAIQAYPASLSQKLFCTLSKLKSRFFSLLASFGLRTLIVETAFSYFYQALFLRTKACKADLYIGHNPISLPVVVNAAKIHQGLCAFDAEDFHTGEYPQNQRRLIHNRLLSYLESMYLPQCDYVSAASYGIAEQLQKTYTIPAPLILLNVFSWQDRVQWLKFGEYTPSDRKSAQGIVSLYWYSQIISKGRGLEQAIEAVCRSNHHLEFHLRGRIDEQTRSEFISIADKYKKSDCLFFHGLVPPEQLLARAAEHDIGLCLESPETLNRDICITNKIFLYMQAGLCLLASDTRGQTEVFERSELIPGVLYKADDQWSLFNALQYLLSHKQKINEHKKNALLLAEKQWNWELEQQKLLKQVQLTLHHQLTHCNNFQFMIRP